MCLNRILGIGGGSGSYGKYGGHIFPRRPLECHMGIAGLSEVRHPDSGHVPETNTVYHLRQSGVTENSGSTLPSPRSLNDHILTRHPYPYDRHQWKSRGASTTSPCWQFTRQTSPRMERQQIHSTKTSRGQFKHSQKRSPHDRRHWNGLPSHLTRQYVMYRADSRSAIRVQSVTGSSKWAVSIAE